MASFVKAGATTTVLFGKNATAEIGRRKLVSDREKVLVLTGAGGSAERCGALSSLINALPAPPVLVLRQVSANPTAEQCVGFAKQANAAGVTLIVAVGGGSVCDAAKFTSVAMEWLAHGRSEDPFDCVVHWAGFEADFEPRPAARIGVVVTRPGSGSETNSSCVVSHAASRAKQTLTHPSLQPVFAVLDPTHTFTLPRILVAEGIADAFSHVLEQYTAHTTTLGCALQDRQAEALLLTLLEAAGPALQTEKPNFEARAAVMWAAAQAQDGLIACGTDGCWAAHAISHEITAFCGSSHPQTIAVILPQVLEFELETRVQKLAQLATRVFGIQQQQESAADAENQLAHAAISKIRAFFSDTLGLRPRLSECGIADETHFAEIAGRFEFALLGAECNIDQEVVAKILHASF